MNNRYLLSVLFILTIDKIEISQERMVPKIVGGQICDAKTHPSIVSIFSHTVCGGSLVTYQMVLTAAHCIEPKYIDDRTIIRAGYTSDPKLVKFRSVNRTILHEKFNPIALSYGADLRYDIGLILLNQSFEASLAIQPIQLPEKGFTSSCHKAAAVGIGLTSAYELAEFEKANKRPLMCVELTVIHDIKVCKETYSHAQIDDTVFCTAEVGKDTCTGDSGGPIICGNKVIGLVSYGPDFCGSSGAAATYTKVECYLDFIDEHINPKGKKPEVKKSENESLKKKTTKMSLNQTTHENASQKNKYQKNCSQKHMLKWELLLLTLLLDLLRD